MQDSALSNLGLWLVGGVDDKGDAITQCVQVSVDSEKQQTPRTYNFALVFRHYWIATVDRSGQQNESTAILLDRLHHNGAGAALGLTAPPSPYAGSVIGAGQNHQSQPTAGMGYSAALAKPVPNFGAQSAYAPSVSYDNYAPAPMPVPVPAPQPAPLQTFDHSRPFQGSGYYSAQPVAAPAAQPSAPPQPAQQPQPMPGGGRYTAAATSHWNQQAAAGIQGTWGSGSAASAAAPSAQASTTSKVNVTVETADTSNVPAQYKVRVIYAVTVLFLTGCVSARSDHGLSFTGNRGYTY